MTALNIFKSVKSNSTTTSKWLLSFFLILTCQVSIGSNEGPNNGSSFTSIAIGGSTSSWQNPSYAQISDNQYAQNAIFLTANGEYTDYLVATDFGFSLSSNVIVNGIVIDVEKSSSIGSKTGDYRVRIIKGGVVGTGDESITGVWGNSDVISTYGSDTSKWAETWLYSDINASNFGFAIAVYRQGGGSDSIVANIDEIRITVYFTQSLPITLSSMNAEVIEHKVFISWSSVTEINNDYYTVEKSRDGVEFQELATIDGAGKSFLVRKYGLIDEELPIGTSYYRLTQTDYDGNTQSFPVVSVIYEAPVTASFSVFPNPVRRGEKLFLEFIESTENRNPLDNSAIQIMLLDNLGREVYSTTITKEESPNKFMDISTSLTPGIYYVISRNSTEVYVKKLMVK
ncbi:MAG: T9SS type A sorting domain-containing protein [Bacteroidetes bacterium]|nr:T9SS type A sorting domain-containing protein [Bacteroidota bacterium]